MASAAGGKSPSIRLTTGKPRRATTAPELCNSCWKPLRANTPHFPASIRSSDSGKIKPAVNHPCLFCHECLQTCSPEYSECVGSYTQRDVANTNMDDGVKGTTPLLANPHTDRLLSKLVNAPVNVPANISRVPFGLKDRNSSDYRRGKLDVYRQALETLDRTATRCGFCRSPKDLRLFCVHCRKRICCICAASHTQNPLYKHHATVNLKTNSGLL